MATVTKRLGNFVLKFRFEINNHKRNCASGQSLKNYEKYYRDLGEKKLASKISAEEWNSAKPYSEIPGPKSLPIIGNSWRYFFGDLNLREFFKLFSQMHDRYGEICVLRDIGGLDDIVLAFKPEDIGKLLANEQIWPVRMDHYGITTYRKSVRKELFGDVGGLITVNGEEWFKLRTVINPIIMKPMVVDNYIDKMCEVADDFLQNIRRFADTDDLMPDNFEFEIYKWSFESIGLLSLDKRLGCLDPKPKHEIQELIESMLSLLKMMAIIDFSPIGKLAVKLNLQIWKDFVKYEDVLANYTLKCIEEAEKDLIENPVSTEQETIFQKLIKVDKKVAFVMILDILSAGIDTTGKMAGSALYHIAYNKRVQDKLRKELCTLLPSPDSPITTDILKEAHYLKAVLKEAMRISPIVIGMLRLLTKDLVLSGYQIPKGVTVMVPNMHLCTNKKYYKNPNDFIPERWLTSEKEKYATKEDNRYAFLPFGFGGRACVGKRLAELELHVLLAKVLRNYELSWPHPEATFQQDLLYSIKDPLKIKMTPISN